MNYSVKIYHGKDSEKLFNDKSPVPLTNNEKKKIVSCLEPIEILSLFHGFDDRQNSNEMVESMYERLQMYKFIIISDQKELDDDKKVSDIKYNLNGQKTYYAESNLEKIDIGVHVYHQKDINNIIDQKYIKKLTKAEQKEIISSLKPLTKAEHKEIVSSLKPDDILSIFYGYYNSYDNMADMVEILYKKLKMDRFEVMTDYDLIEIMENPY
jgi:hypothetical protein